MKLEEIAEFTLEFLDMCYTHKKPVDEALKDFKSVTNDLFTVKKGVASEAKKEKTTD